MPIWALILTSAAVGAIVSSLVTFIGQFLERKHQRETLALNFALDLAKERTELVKQIADKKGLTADLYDLLYVAANYYPSIMRLLKEGRLPQEFVEIAEKKVGQVQVDDKEGSKKLQGVD
jgi:hypothetical protein